MYASRDENIVCLLLISESSVLVKCINYIWMVYGEKKNSCVFQDHHFVYQKWNTMNIYNWIYSLVFVDGELYMLKNKLFLLYR